MGAGRRGVWSAGRGVGAGTPGIPDRPCMTSVTHIPGFVRAALPPDLLAGVDVGGVCSEAVLAADDLAALGAPWICPVLVRRVRALSRMDPLVLVMVAC